MNRRTVATNCPYCGAQVLFSIDGNKHGPGHRVLTCLPDWGGCDQEFAVTTRVQVDVVRYRLLEVYEHMVDEDLYRDHRDEVEEAARP